MAVLEKHYAISHDCEGKRYLYIGLDWDHDCRKIHLSVLLYVKEAPIRFNHAVPRHHQYQPHLHTKPKYGQKLQYTKEEDSSHPLTAAKKKLAQ